MPTPYFQKIPTIGYDIDGSGEKRAAVNILQRVKIRDLLKDQFYVFYEYNVKDGETPEIIAHKLYGSTSYHWIVLLANDIIDPYYDWPMSYENMILTIRKKYTTPQRDGVEYAQTTTHHYEDVYGNVIDEYSYKLLPVAERKEVKIYEWEMAENEKKRTIRLLDKRMVDQIDAEMNQIMTRPLV